MNHPNLSICVSCLMHKKSHLSVIFGPRVARERKKKNHWKFLSYFFYLNVREQSTVSHYLGNVKSNNVHFVGSSHAPLFKSQSLKFEMKMYLRQNDSQLSNRKNDYLTWDA